jgi:hypothetical protein
MKRVDEDTHFFWHEFEESGGVGYTKREILCMLGDNNSLNTMFISSTSCSFRSSYLLKFSMPYFDMLYAFPSSYGNTSSTLV